MKVLSMISLLLFSGAACSIDMVDGVGNDLSIVQPGAAVFLDVYEECSFSYSNNIVEFGNFTAAELESSSDGSGAASIGKRTLNVLLACSHEQDLSIAVNGDQVVNGNFAFGDKGRMVVKVLDAQVDGNSINFTRVLTAGASAGQVYSDLVLEPGDSFSPTSGNGNLKGKYFNFTVEVEVVFTKEELDVYSSEVIYGALRFKKI